MRNYCLVEVFGNSCANCFAMLPVVTNTAKNLQIAMRRVDISDLTPQDVERYNITKVPTVLLLDGDMLVGKCAGYQPEEIFTIWVEAKIEEYQKNTTASGQ